MFEVPSNSDLVKIHEFRLQRPGKGPVWIEVAEHLNSTSKISFYAVPINWPFRSKSPKEEYKSNGQTLPEALNALLSSIGDVATADIFEKKEKK